MVVDEPMSINYIVCKAFKLFKLNFKSFLTIATIIYLPISILVYASQSLVIYSTHLETLKPSTLFIQWLAAFYMSILFTIGWFFSQAAFATGILGVNLKTDLSIKAVFKSVLARFWTVVGAGFLVGVIVLTGATFCVVPGIIFGLWFSLTIPSIIIEGKGVIDGMRRSRQLVKGQLGKVFLVILIAYIISLIIPLPFYLISKLFTSIAIFNSPYISLLVRSIFGVIGYVISLPISSCTIILLYHDLRLRKEKLENNNLPQQTH